MDSGRISAIIHTTAAKTMAIAQSPSQGQSPWHSPVPYLFGGLAAMLGLIAFALLILACSYWRLSGRLEAERDLEAGEESENGGEGGEMKKIGKPVVSEEKFLVILAGQQNPTCLATPMSSRASSFASTTGTTDTGSTSVEDEKKKEEESKINLGEAELGTTTEENSSTNQAHQVS